MVPSWLRFLSQKVVRAHALRKRHRPAWRPRVRPHFDVLETRTVMSAFIEPPDLLPPTFGVGDVPPASTPQDPSPGFNQRLDTPDSAHPGWGRLLQDVVAGSRPAPPAPAGFSPPSDFGGTTFDAPSEPAAVENPAGNVRGRGSLRLPDPLRPHVSPANPAVGPDLQPRSLPGPSTTSPARAPQVDRTATRGVSGPQPTAAGAPSGEIDRPPEAPAAKKSFVPPRPAAAAASAAPSARGAALPSPGDMPDGSLLQRYAAHRDEVAFAALVQRHERLVFGVCHRVLGDSSAAQDAFQATFLVLARKAGILDRNSPLAGWLYKVAYHLALRLRTVAARQRRREAEAASAQPLEFPGTDATEIETQEMREALREELQLLPEKYRVPLVLCYFHGHTHDEAARVTGMPRGSMAKRIGEGLERLRERLADRGFAL